MKNSDYFWLSLFILILILITILNLTLLFYLGLFLISSYLIYSIWSYMAYLEKLEAPLFKYGLHILIIKFNNWLNSL